MKALKVAMNAFTFVREMAQKMFEKFGVTWVRISVCFYRKTEIIREFHKDIEV